MSADAFSVLRLESGGAPVHIYGPRHDAGDIARAVKPVARSPHVCAPVVLLPDHHRKPAMETPSSSVVLTRRFFCLSLSSPSQNCGMSALGTSLSEQDLTPARVAAFMTAVRTALPLRAAGPRISEADVRQALQHGAAWALNRYEMPADTGERIEHGGALPNARRAPEEEVVSVVPAEVVRYAQHRFGLIGGGNHFLELQTVDEICDAGIARIWGLHKHQVVVMLHTGSDVVGAYLGRLYAGRKKTPLLRRLYFLRQKIRRHLMRRPWEGLAERFAYYFMPGPFRFIDAETAEGKRVLLSVDCAANYGFASRVSIFRAVENALRQATGSGSMQARLIYDCSHNSIYPEMSGGALVWAHRHNACLACPPGTSGCAPAFCETGTPVLLPGTHRVSSHICAAGAGAAATHYTVDHGLGALHSIAAEGRRAGRGQVRLFGYDRDVPESLPRLADDAVSAAVRLLHGADIITPVVRLKPVATLKGPKSTVV